MSISVDVLARVASYFTPISHTPGRLRVRVSSAIKELKNEIDISNLDEYITKINGIENVKFNKIIGSVTIQYDASVFAKSDWDNLLNGQNLDEISNKINKIAKGICSA
ncbi:hypothetical protein LMG7974_00651 [Campylobacter majalis]|uniref:Cation transporter n=1 Tax=Campylobacter majalis TaxID=2790656 RepID=A0ABM8Q4S2_9BACT|nr:hypothetical protein [Campylobacter majalis]CAD7287770.1 hypothetical protein LMG7974_00651 [Campylobacter majalis]